jgi:high-affinity iron transporter
MRLIGGLAGLLLLAASLACRAQDASLAVHLLDYIAVDYSHAVADGKVKSADEYKEMTQFAANVTEAISKLPPVAAKAALEVSAQSLAARIGAKASPAEVSALAQKLRQEVVAAYAVAIGPKRAPDLARGRALFAEHCATCHGATGLGDGIAAKGLDPAPTNFHDPERQRLRSAYGLYNTITRGVEGTAMRSFRDLPEDDRWALAYVASNFLAGEPERAHGKALWAAADKSKWSSQSAIAGRTPAEVEAQGGADALAIQAYLRANPGALEAAKPSPLAFARANLALSAELHAKGDVEGATQAALTAYLEGFELVEASLAQVDNDLMRRIEAAMVDYRNALKSASHPEIQAQASRIDAMLAQASDALSTSLSPGASFVASLVILLREGLEAVLVVAALLAFLRRGGQSHALRYVHAGWIAALAMGALTWYAANSLIAVSGEHREVTEGILGLVAAAMLLYVGFWLHDKSSAQAWQQFLMRGATEGAAWGLAVMAFLAVYREVFETVLFYEALWLQSGGQGGAIGAGFAVALALLAAITFAMLRYSLRMPLGLFFGTGGILLAVLAVIMAGNGVASLQEAGWLPVTPIAFFTVSWLGIHPNLQSIGTQVVLAIAVVVLLRASSRRSAAP